MTEDEHRILEIEQRVRARVLKTDANEHYLISRADFDSLLASRLAWKYTAKCFAANTEAGE